MTHVFAIHGANRHRHIAASPRYSKRRTPSAHNPRNVQIQFLNETGPQGLPDCTRPPNPDLLFSRQCLRLDNRRLNAIGSENELRFTFGCLHRWVVSQDNHRGALDGTIAIPRFAISYVRRLLSITGARLKHSGHDLTISTSGV